MRLHFVLALATLLLLSPLTATSAAAQFGRGNQPPAGPAPRADDGKLLLGAATPTDKGLWLGAFGGLGTAGSNQLPMDSIPWKPWSRALFIDRQTHELEPHARCKVSGVTRQFQTPYGVEILELAELQRIFIFDVGGPHTFRTIYMDGRTIPPDPPRSGYGYSIGWWEGDTLAVETTGFDESFWLDRRGIPHTEELRTLERFTRTDERTIEYELTIDDPGAFSAPWSGGFNLRWSSGPELFEYICQQGNQGFELMLGDYESVDRSTTTIP